MRARSVTITMEERSSEGRSNEAAEVAALGASEDRYRTLFETLDEGFTIVETVRDGAGRLVDLMYLETNPAYVRHTGFDPAAGTRVKDVAPDIEDDWMEFYDRVATTGVAGSKESYNADLNRWFRTNVTRIGGEQSPLLGIVVEDVTARHIAEQVLREREERQAYLLRLSDGFRAQPDAPAVARFALRALCDQLKLDRCYIARIRVAEDWAEYLYQIGNERVPPVPAGIHVSPFPRESQAELEAPWVIGDLAAADIDEGDREILGRLGHRALIAKFLRIGDEGDASWVMCGLSADARQWTAGEVALVEETAERSWAAMERLRAEHRLRQSEERQRLTVELVPVLLWSASPDAREVTLNERWLAYTGQTAAETQNYGWLAAIHPDDLPATSAAFEHAFATGDPLELQHRIRKAHDGYRWHLIRHVPVRDERGSITRWFGAAFDIHDSKLAEQALQRTERRLQTLVEGVPQLVWRASEPGKWTWASPQWMDYTGQPEIESHDWGWLDPVHPEDHARVREIWGGAAVRGEFQAEYRLFHAVEGRYRWFQTRATPVRDEKGAIVEWLGTSTDIDDLRQLQQRQQVLVTELQHRTFNLMGVVRSMADATIRSSRGLSDFKGKFRDRIDALARVQRLLSRLAEGARVTFDELIRSELAAAAALPEEDARVSLNGPLGVPLRSSTVQTFAMAIHELTTNALKYGALKQPDAHLVVRWRVEQSEDGGPWLHVDWAETGVTLPNATAASTGGGQGRMLIEQALPYQLRARTSYALTPQGVCCKISLPVSDPAPSEGQSDHA